MALRVLVVDDDPAILELVEDILEDQGADAVTSDFPGDIAGLVRHVQPDVLLLDLWSPHDNLAGLVILGDLRAGPLTASLPVVLFSADSVWLSGQTERLQELGVSVVGKPFNIHRLWQTIEQAAQPSLPGALPNASAQRS